MINVNLERSISEALEWSSCTLKKWDEKLSVHTVEHIGNVREFVRVFVVQDGTGEEMEWIIDINNPDPIYKRLLVSNNWVLVTEILFEMWDLLFSRTVIDNPWKLTHWIYFIDLNLEVQFPKWYEFYAANDNYFDAVDPSWNILRYYASDIRNRAIAPEQISKV